MTSIKAEFRHIFGYDFEHRCGDCAYCIGQRANRTHYKCKKMGMTHSNATDIRLKDAACKLFKEEEDETD